MKKIILITTLSIASVVTAQAADHRHNDIRGVIVGAGGGALLGQAIGRNTQSTVIGTAIGSVVGYLVGSEMDTNNGYSSHTPRSHYQPVRYRSYETVKEYRKPPPYRKKQARRSECRETEFLGTIHGKARKIYGVACKTPQGWKLVSQHDRPYDNYNQHTSYHRSGHDDRDYNRKPQHIRWKKHRF